MTGTTTVPLDCDNPDPDNIEREECDLSEPHLFAARVEAVSYWYCGDRFGTSWSACEPDWEPSWEEVKYDGVTGIGL